ncbi:MAG: hypothetical protein WCU00_08945 [Candidatus Latescibacterota bacterium]
MLSEMILSGYARVSKFLFASVIIPGILFLAFTLPAGGAVLVSDAELAQAKINLNKEPFQSYVRKASSGDGGGAAPVLYILTGERKYAVKARSSTLESMDYLQKYIPYMVDIWILRSPYQTVSAILAYDMTRNSGVYTDEDRRKIEKTLSWTITHYLNKGKDHLGKGFLYQTDYIPEDKEEWVTANMNVNRLLAVGLYGLVFTSDPRSKDIIRYSNNYFERILSLGSRPGGAWNENPRYAGGVLQQLYLLAAALKNAGVHDYFQDDRFKKMLGFFSETNPVPAMEGPNRPTMLAADDSHWWENQGVILGWAASRYAGSDPKMAGEWTWSWQNLGSPLTPESLLFANPELAPVKPSYASYLPGMGYVLFRERFAEKDESLFFATFGPELGTSNNTMHHQPNHGDFSFIWRGFPLTLTRGAASYVWSRRMLDQVDYSHSVVTFDGAGKTLAIPEKKYSTPAVEVNTTIDESLARDFYPDGVAHFLSTPGFDYTSGEVSNWDIGLPASFNRRHFLFLKPDALVIWDQVRSSYPLQWNFHIPAENVTGSGNTITLANREGVKLSIDFLQDKPIDYTLDWPTENLREDWPMVLRCPYGKGMFIFNALDIARQVIDQNHEGARKILENILSYPSRPKRIGLIETDGQTAQILKKLGMAYELLDYKALGGDISRFDRIIVGQFAVLVRDRDMADYREKLWKYVENGGVCYWAYQYAWGWKPGDDSGPGYFPKTLMVGEGTSVLWGEGIELWRPVKMNDDPIWNSPNRITAKDWDGWAIGRPDTFKVMPIYPILPNTDRARNIPVYYSDHWEVLASALRTYNINVPQTRSHFGPYRWIKIHHQPSEDYFAVLRPWKEGVNGSKSPAEILKGAETDAIISQGADTWRILLGDHPGIKSTFTLLKYRTDQVPTTVSAGKKAVDENSLSSLTPDEVFLVDALEAKAGALGFGFQNPATLYFNSAENAGSLSLLEGGIVSLPWKVTKAALVGSQLVCAGNDAGTSLTLPAGEYTFRLSGESLVFELKNHAAQVEVVDINNKPVQWVHVFRGLAGQGRTLFQGATGTEGRISLRWEGNEEQQISLEKDGKSVKMTLKPGVQKVVWK